MKNYPQAAGVSVQNKNKCGSDGDSAAAPFLQGVKVDSMDTAPKNGDEFLARCGKEWPWFSCFWDGSAFVHYDHTDGIVHYPATEWIPIPKRMLAPAPYPRAQALEEAAKIAFDVSENGHYYGEASVDSTSSIYQQGAFEVYEALRSLSSQPVATTRPTGGTNHGE